MSGTKHFCCCIPVRFGVFVIALLSLLGSGVFAAAVWFTLAHQGDSNVVDLSDGSLKRPFIAAGVHYTIIAIASLMGLIGAIFRKRGFVAFFSGFLWGSLVINIAVGGYGIYWTLKHASEAEQMCKDRLKDVLNGGNADNAKQVCLNAPLAKGLSIGIFVVAMLFLLYGAIIVQRYYRQLGNDRWENGPAKHFATIPQPESHPMPASNRHQAGQSFGNASYQPVGSHDHDAHHANTGSYAYADPAHSYGSKV